MNNKIARELPIRDDGQTMITGSHQTLNIQIGTEYQENHLFVLWDQKVLQMQYPQ